MQSPAKQAGVAEKANISSFISIRLISAPREPATLDSQINAYGIQFIKKYCEGIEEGVSGFDQAARTQGGMIG
jgi:hypothetical protein